jgi:energy-coupling factor transporter ATP-binding protein EcfA2
MEGKKTRFINVRFTEKEYADLHSRALKPSKIIREAVELWLNYYSFGHKDVELRENENYALIGKSGAGKTSLIKQFLKAAQKTKLVFETHKDYSGIYDVHSLKYDGLENENDPKFKLWAIEEIKRIAPKLVDNLVIQSDIKNPAAQAMLLTEILKKAVDVKADKGRVVIMENAEVYQDVLVPFVSQFQKNNIQMIMSSQVPLKNEILANVTPVVGSMGLEIKSTSLPPEVSRTASVIKPYEWLWFDRSDRSWKKHGTQLPENVSQAIASQQPKPKPRKPRVPKVSKEQKPQEPVSNVTQNIQTPQQDQQQPK